MSDKLIMRDEILHLIKKEELVITPLLDQNQIGQIAIDLRVGTDFLTAQQGREPYIDTTIDEIEKRPIRSFFNETRRHLGEDFLFHPNQTVLFSTLEYIKLPKNVMAVLSTRSSYSRLGLNVSTIVQPGYCGCISVEICYGGNTAVKVLSGTRLLQMRLYQLDNAANYFDLPRKYICQVRPIASKANEDTDLELLKRIARRYD